MAAAICSSHGTPRRAAAAPAAAAAAAPAKEAIGGARRMSAMLAAGGAAESAIGQRAMIEALRCEAATGERWQWSAPGRGESETSGAMRKATRSMRLVFVH